MLAGAKVFYHLAIKADKRLAVKTGFTDEVCRLRSKPRLDVGHKELGIRRALHLLNLGSGEDAVKIVNSFRSGSAQVPATISILRTSAVLVDTRSSECHSFLKHGKELQQLS